MYTIGEKVVIEVHPRPAAPDPGVFQMTRNQFLTIRDSLAVINSAYNTFLERRLDGFAFGIGDETFVVSSAKYWPLIYIGKGRDGVVTGVSLSKEEWRRLCQNVKIVDPLVVSLSN